jgi:hypothetical protein
MSLYNRVYTNFYTHRKTARLRVKLGNDALWLPPRFWAYAAENQPDGVFQDYDPNELAHLVGYTGDAQAMLQALLEAGFLDPDPLRIHEWDFYNQYHAAFSQRASKAASARWNKEKGFPSDSLSLDTTGKERTGQDRSKQCLSIDKQCLEHPTPTASRVGAVARGGGVKMFPSEVEKQLKAITAQYEALKREYEREPDEQKASLIKDDLTALIERKEELETMQRGFPLKSGMTPEYDTQTKKKPKGINI